MAQVTPIRAQPAPPPAQAAPPPALPPAAPDNTIGFALSRPALTITLLLSVVLALLIYVAGFFTALALIVASDSHTNNATPAATVSSAPPAIAKPALVSPALPAAPQAPAAQTPVQARPSAQSETTGQASATQPPPAPAQAPAGQQPVAAPPPPTPGSNADSTTGMQAPVSSVPRRLPAPVPARIADAANLLRSADGRVSLPPRPSLPPPTVSVRRAADAVSNAAAAPPTPAEPPAVIAEAKQLPATRENALLTPPPARPVPPGQLNWTLQAGAFLGQDHANALVGILTGRGYKAYILQTTDNRNRVWYRVRIGDYGSRREAQEAAQSFERKEGREAIVVRRLIDAAQPPQG